MSDNSGTPLESRTMLVAIPACDIIDATERFRGEVCAFRVGRHMPELLSGIEIKPRRIYEFRITAREVDLSHE